MENKTNEKECIAVRKGNEEIALFDSDRRQRIYRAVRRLLFVLVVALAVVVFIGSDFAAEHGFGIGVLRSFFGKDDDETIPPSYSEESDTNEGVGEATEEGNTEEEILESEICESDQPEVDILEIDLSEKDKGNVYFVNYSNETPDAEGILAEGFSGVDVYYTERPVVLIVHSQTGQAYSDADDDITAFLNGVVSVGERISYELNRRGIPTVHCTVIHDGEGEPYKNTASTVKTMLEIYPTLEYVIDIQRMNITDDRGGIAKTLVTDGSAQTRITVSATGEGWRENFSLAMSIREKMNAEEKSLCIPVVLTDVSYNSGLSKYYLKIDVGALGNTSDEAKCAGVLFAEAFAQTVKK